MSECSRCGRPLGGEHCVYCGRLGADAPTPGPGDPPLPRRAPASPPGGGPSGGSAAASGGGGVTLVQILVGVAVIALVAIVLWPSSEDGPTVEEGAHGQASPAGPGTVRARLDAMGLNRNPIERARLATVQLRLGIASGTAFLFDDDCHAFTNRHVIDPLAYGQGEDVGEALRIAEREARRRRALIEAKRRELEDRCPSCSYLDIDDALAEAERQLDQFEEEIRRVRGGIADVESSRIVAVLADGYELEAEVVWRSDTSDLAVVKLQGRDCPYLHPAPDDDLEYGQPLFTVGNPLGLQHTVTSGVFSGYREVEQRRMIQTDAPINSGNSGGPLLTEAGRVVGIATSVARDAQGIGFAIPYSEALEEWGRTL